MNRRNRILVSYLLGAGLLMISGCQAGGPADMPSERQRREMFSLMLPSQVKIQPFTKVTSFDDDRVPDGILAVLRPLDRFGDPVKAVGLFYFELWTYRKASGDHKGERLAYWERAINSAQEVNLYWTWTRMYEFQLAWVQGVEQITPDAKFVLTATYRAPWDETMQDEYIIDYHIPRELLSKSQ